MEPRIWNKPCIWNTFAAEVLLYTGTQDCLHIYQAVLDAILLKNTYGQIVLVHDPSLTIRNSCVLG